MFAVARGTVRMSSSSTDGRAAAVLRSLPLDSRRHLLARWVARAAPALAASLVLTGASVAALRPAAATAVSALAIAAAGGLAIPALHIGLGGLFPRYDGPNPVAVALGPGGLFALVLSTGLSLFSTLAVSRELRLLLGGLLRIHVPAWPLLLAFFFAAALAAAIPMALAAQALTRSDISLG